MPCPPSPPRPAPLHALAGAGLLALAVAAAAAAPSPLWGVNGHPLSQAPYYGVPITRQLDLLAELGAGWYRFDLNATAFRAETARLDSLLDEAARRGIRLLPILFASPDCRTPGATPAQVRAGARDFGRAIAARYRGRITHWELENELDYVCMIRRGETDRRGRRWDWDGAPEGSAPEDYLDARYELAKAEIAGLGEGVHQGDPAARTVVDTSGWLHTGFIARLVTEDQVPFDVLAWHWYSNMGDITRVAGRIDLLARLRAFGRPVWITEIGWGEGSADAGGAGSQAAYLATTVAAMGANPGLGPLFYYELLDEPYPHDDTRYGLIEVARRGEGPWALARKKPAFEAYRRVIAASAASAR